MSAVARSGQQPTGRGVVATIASRWARCGLVRSLSSAGSLSSVGSRSRVGARDWRDAARIGGLKRDCKLPSSGYRRRDPVHSLFGRQPRSNRVREAAGDHLVICLPPHDREPFGIIGPGRSPQAHAQRGIQGRSTPSLVRSRWSRTARTFCPEFHRVLEGFLRASIRAARDQANPGARL